MAGICSRSRRLLEGCVGVMACLVCRLCNIISALWLCPHVGYQFVVFTSLIPVVDVNIVRLSSMGECVRVVVCSPMLFTYYNQ